MSNPEKSPLEPILRSEMKRYEDMYAHALGIIQEYESMRIAEIDPLETRRIGIRMTHLRGQLAEYEDQIKRVSAKLDSIEKRPFPSEKLVVTASPGMKILPTSAYLSLPISLAPLITLSVENQTSQPVQVRLSCELRQYSQPSTELVTSAPGRCTSIMFRPPLRVDRLKQIHDSLNSQIHVTAEQVLEVGHLVLLERDFELRLLARDIYVYARRGDDGVMENLSYLLAAWVTPNEPALEPAIRGAQRRCRMQGYPVEIRQDPVTTIRDQIKAIYLTLKEDIGVAYSNALSSHDQDYNYLAQRVRLPKETMQIQGANCIDGSVVFASLIEYFSMQPVIVLMPGHAFVGWKVSEDAAQYEFLETTLLKEADFETAHARGQATFKKLEDRGFFKRAPFDPLGYAMLIDIVPFKKEKHPVLLSW